MYSTHVCKHFIYMYTVYNIHAYIIVAIMNRLSFVCVSVCLPGYKLQMYYNRLFKVGFSGVGQCLCIIREDSLLLFHFASLPLFRSSSSIFSLSLYIFLFLFSSAPLSISLLPSFSFFLPLNFFSSFSIETHNCLLRLSSLIFAKISIIALLTLFLRHPILSPAPSCT